MISNISNRHVVDPVTVVIYFFLVLTGISTLYAVGRPPEGYAAGDVASLLNSFAGKQFIWLVISLGAWFLVDLFIDRQTWVVGAYPIYIGTVVLLVLVLLIGKEINNARSWFSVAGFTFQPSELAKFGACLAMAAFLSQYTGKMEKVRNILTGTMIWVIPAIFIVLQPDPGSALVFASFLLVMYREGLPGILLLFGFFTAAMFLLGIVQDPKVLAGALLVLLSLAMSFSVPQKSRWWVLGTLGVSALAIWSHLQLDLGWPILGVLTLNFLVLAGYLLVRQRTQVAVTSLVTLVWGGALATLANFFFNNVLMPHQQDRINAWLRPDGMDERGALYNIIQSKLAIAGGGFSGRGMFEGIMTKYDYVPEQETDFIFSAIGEGQGFVGSFSIILGFLFLLWRLSVIAERQTRTFARAFTYGVAGIITLHVLVNIGMTMGLMPVIGIPLPFISKGGSSLLSFTLMIAVVLKFDRMRGVV
ncbi:rod shape-determining protein RodA [Neolewinella antarctica]|uniref:Rod shape determining protein RodA n=1 Tax=Neolewinella antarctica TaxID=442734 RepID=A0ABX0XF66_9BACT|nr:rod shape-determining protein RodA [Neolewinella antarctica]NJC27524.1 rod shape determining protein RodA [Neolewinella antarctica]